MAESRKQTAPIDELVRQTSEKAGGERTAGCPEPRAGAQKEAPEAPRETRPARSLALYVGLMVLVCQLVFVYAFFPSFESAREVTHPGRRSPTPTTQADQPAHDGRYAMPDLLQWSGAQSLTWIASLFAPDTPVRLAPALLFFLVAGGFFAALYHPARAGSMIRTVGVSARTGMRLWLSWFAGAAILLVYLVTSSGGMAALRVSAGITFPRSWKDIADAFLSHWLVYVAWFALLGLVPMLGGMVLGLLRTRFLTRPVQQSHPEDERTVEASCREPEARPSS